MGADSVDYEWCLRGDRVKAARAGCHIGRWPSGHGEFGSHRQGWPTQDRRIRRRGQPTQDRVRGMAGRRGQLTQDRVRGIAGRRGQPTQAHTRDGAGRGGEPARADEVDAKIVWVR